jgi:predicted peptidase
MMKNENTSWTRLKTTCNFPVFEYSATNSPSRRVVILYLHGSGERGIGIWKMRLDSLPKLVEVSGRFPFRVVAPVCPLRSEWTKQMKDLKILVRKLRDKYRYIFVTGPSMGGRGCWHLAASCSDLIAGIIPICGGGRKIFASLVANRVPCWFFHAANDTCIDVSETDNLVSSIRSLTPSDRWDLWCRYTRYEHCNSPWNAPWFEGHDSFNPCYRYSDVWKWVINVVSMFDGE